MIGKPSVRPCWRCGTFDGVLYRSSMTMYDTKAEPNSDDDPNRDHELCEKCWLDYEDHWQYMWDSYNSGRL